MKTQGHAVLGYTLDPAGSVARLVPASERLRWPESGNKVVHTFAIDNRRSYVRHI